MQKQPPIIYTFASMRHLLSLNKYFWKYKWLFLLGIIFIVLSNYFRILSPQITRYVLNIVEVSLSPSEKAVQPNSLRESQQPGAETALNPSSLNDDKTGNYDPLVQRLVVNQFENSSFKNKIIACGIILLALALVSGFFMFLMRQTIIVMSRHIEYEQKNEIFDHYQKLDTGFYKTHNTGDLMNRISEDVSRVRMYTGPAVMYLINLAATIGFSV
ncbi:MAG: ABC transporter transmembrane domain-containing protein, partial [Ginsengibacter sp.]